MRRISGGSLLWGLLAVVLLGVPTGTFPLQPAAHGPAAPIAHTQRTGTVRIMPLGASSTVGKGSSKTAGYRGPLQVMLRADGIEVDMVGSRRDGPPTVADRDHEGISGITLEEMAPQVAGWVQDADPDVILLHNGTNDLLQGRSPDEAVRSLDDNLRAIAEVANVHVIVAGVWAPLPGKEAEREEFESLAAGLIDRYVEHGWSMRFVDATGLLTEDQLADGLHPNDTGYQRIARMWRGEIHIMLGISSVGP